MFMSGATLMKLCLKSFRGTFFTLKVTFLEFAAFLTELSAVVLPGLLPGRYEDVALLC